MMDLSINRFRLGAVILALGLSVPAIGQQLLSSKSWSGTYTGSFWNYEQSAQIAFNVRQYGLVSYTVDLFGFELPGDGTLFAGAGPNGSYYVVRINNATTPNPNLQWSQYLDEAAAGRAAGGATLAGDVIANGQTSALTLTSAPAPAPTLAQPSHNIQFPNNKHLYFAIEQNRYIVAHQQIDENGNIFLKPGIDDRGSWIKVRLIGSGYRNTAQVCGTVGPVTDRMISIEGATDFFCRAASPTTPTTPPSAAGLAGVWRDTAGQNIYLVGKSDGNYYGYVQQADGTYDTHNQFNRGHSFKFPIQGGRQRLGEIWSNEGLVGGYVYQNFDITARRITAGSHVMTR